MRGITQVCSQRFNAARGFVGGAAIYSTKHEPSILWFQCRTRLCGWCSVSGSSTTSLPACFNAARGFVGGAANMIQFVRVLSMSFNAARGFVGGAADMVRLAKDVETVSMPHAALWVVQPSKMTRYENISTVSMPHAALWVVQPYDSTCSSLLNAFQCRTRLCGWCSFSSKERFSFSMYCFNAARGFVGGAAI